MSLSREQILDAVSEMSVMDIVELVKMMEEKFDVTAAAPSMAVAAPAAGGDAAAEEKSEFDAVLTGFGSNKVAVIKVVRAVTGLGLKEAKELVEGGGALKEAVSKEEAADVKKQVEEAGGTVEVK